MDSMNVALHFNNIGAQALASSKVPKAIVQLTKSMNMMKQSFVNTDPQPPSSDCDSDGLDTPQDAAHPCPYFTSCTSPVLENHPDHYICADAIGLTDRGIEQMISKWKDRHICSAIVTFNVALMYHQQALGPSDNTTRQSLRKARKMYKMAHELLFDCHTNIAAIRRVAWRIKLSAIHNLSQIHLMRGDRDTAASGFAYLAWILNIAQRGVCMRVLGQNAYDAILKNSMLYSLALISAPAA